MIWWALKSEELRGDGTFLPNLRRTKVKGRLVHVPDVCRKMRSRGRKGGG